MTRVLQIRRGNAQEHMDFTGLPGEITMDTDNKTICLHDGETIGGIPMARADQIKSNEANFDISGVSDDVWAEIISRFTPPPFDVFETAALPINSKCSFLDCIINTNKTPRFIQTMLICNVPEAGYAVGDQVRAFGIGSRANPMPNTKIKSDQLHICLMVGAETYWVSHNNTGETTQVNDENWSVKFLVYC